MINENGLLNIFPTAEASGSIVSFENGADGIPMESLSVAVEPIQDLHGYDSPWPAGGGKNLYNSDNFIFNGSPTITTKNGITLTRDNGKLAISGTATAETRFDAGYSGTFKSGRTYTISVRGLSNGTIRVVMNGTPSGHGLYYTSEYPTSDFFFTFTVDVDVVFQYFYLDVQNGATVNNVVSIQIEEGSTATSWSPYSNICPISGRTGVNVYVSPTQDQQDATTYAVDWTDEAGTVYGGTVDVVTGVLTVDRIGVDGGSVEWTKVTGNAYRNFVFTPSPLAKYLANRSTVISSQYKSEANNTAGDTDDNYVWIRSNNTVCVKDTSKASLSASDFKTAMTGVQFVWELATPITYQLTPQEVATLLGSNMVWSDAGDISLVYHAQVDATPSSIDGLFINGEGLQADGWFLKWRKLAAPKPKTDYVSVWGRDGDIDLTESETDGQVFYENRELTMDMVYMGEDWTDAYSELLDMLHGKECAVQFSNDPYWYWAGRIIASLYEHKPHSLTMSGIMFPYKLSVAKITKSATVSGAIESNGVEVVLPSSRMRVSPKVTVVAGTGESVTLKWGTKTQTLSAGTYYVRGLKVGSDDVTIKVWGTGTVTFEYRKGML